MPKKNHMNFTEFFVGSASQAVPHVRDNESKGTSTIVSGAPKWSLVISLDPTVVEVVILIDKDTLKMCKMTRTWLLERCFCQQWRGQPQDLEVLEAFRIWKSGSLDITELTDNTSFFGNPFFKAGTWHHSRGPTFHNAVCVCAHVCTSGDQHESQTEKTTPSKSLTTWHIATKYATCNTRCFHRFWTTRITHPLVHPGSSRPTSKSLRSEFTNWSLIASLRMRKWWEMDLKKHIDILNLHKTSRLRLVLLTRLPLHLPYYHSRKGKWFPWPQTYPIKVSRPIDMVSSGHLLTFDCLKRLHPTEMVITFRFAPRRDPRMGPILWQNSNLFQEKRGCEL